jgi:SAM-dependent methyltransferase
MFVPIWKKIFSLIPPKSRVLDVGCGHGRFSIPLAEAGHDVVGTDVSQKMLELLAANKGALPIEIRRGDAHRLASADEEFDVALAIDFMPHFPDWPRFLAEMARACKPGGRLIFNFNFTEHRTFAAPFGGDAFEHPYSPDVNSKKPFWAECPLDEMIGNGEKLGLKLVQVTPVKFLHDSFAFGGALGTEDYRKFQKELAARVDANPAVADFLAWLELGLFQHLPFFAAYYTLVVFEKTTSVRPTGV